MNGSVIGGAKRGAAIGLLVGLPISALMMGTSLEVPFRLFPPAFVLFWGMFPVLFGAIGAAAGYFYGEHRREPAASFGSQRPRWRRWIAAAVLLWLVLPALYTLSVGPVWYALTRGWIDPDNVGTWLSPYTALRAIASIWETTEDLHWDYVRWWIELAQDHEGGP